MSVPAAGIAPSPTTRAATGIARSVRPTRATSGWRRAAELLPAPYVHVVFTLPPNWHHWPCRTRKSSMVLFRSSAETLLEIAADPKHLGAEIGFFSVLHTWDQKLQHHPHVHCVVPAGGLSPDHTRWIPSHTIASSFPSGTQPGVPRQVRRRAQAGPSNEGKLRFPENSNPSRNPSSSRLSAPALPPGLGRLCQTALRWPRTCAPLPGPLHASRRHLQPPPGRLRRRQGHLPLEGLRTPQQTDD